MPMSFWHCFENKARSLGCYCSFIFFVLLYGIDKNNHKGKTQYIDCAKCVWLTSYTLEHSYLLIFMLFFIVAYVTYGSFHLPDPTTPYPSLLTELDLHQSAVPSDSCWVRLVMFPFHHPTGCKTQHKVRFEHNLKSVNKNAKINIAYSSLN